MHPSTTPSFWRPKHESQNHNRRYELRHHWRNSPSKWYKIPSGGGETVIDGTSFQINFSDGLTWVLNKSITNRDFLVGADFTSNGKSFNVLQVTAGKFEPSYIIYDGRVDGMWYAVYNGNWTQEAFRTVTFAEMPTGTLLTWLQANAVQL